MAKWFLVVWGETRRKNVVEVEAGEREGRQWRSWREKARWTFLFCI
jgi:hypothetical protein